MTNENRRFGLLKKVGDVGLVGIVLTATAEIPDHTYIYCEQENLSGIELPSSLQDWDCGCRQPVMPRHLAVEVGIGAARNEYEDSHRVTETTISAGDPTDDIRGNVIEKNQPERQAPDQVEPQIAYNKDWPHHGSRSLWECRHVIVSGQRAP